MYVSMSKIRHIERADRLFKNRCHLFQDSSCQMLIVIGGGYGDDSLGHDGASVIILVHKMDCRTCEPALKSVPLQ